MPYFDTHCHLAGSELLPQAETLAQKAWDRGVHGLCLISAEESCLTNVPALALRLKQQLPQALICHSIGIHPHDSKGVNPQVLDTIQNKVAQAQAVGETGLDFFYDHSPRQPQQDLFRFHIDLAAQTQKPLVIHTRQARRETLDMLNTPAIHNHRNPGIIHCFTEDLDFAKQAVEMGFMISLSGIVTFKNAQALQEVAKWVPDDRLLIETDSPWLAPIPHRGQRNQPAYVVDVFEFICQLRGAQAPQLADLLWANSKRVFQQA